MVEQHIITGCQQNDRRCQQALYESCAAYAYTVVRSYISDSEYIKDVMQDGFAAVFKSISKYDPEKGAFKSWMARIMTYKSIDFLKLHSRVKIHNGLEIIDDLSDDDYFKLDSLSRTEIEELLQSMPDGYRTIFLLNAIDDYNHKEISEMLGISPETSRSQYHRALKWIKKNLSQDIKKASYEAL